MSEAEHPDFQRFSFALTLDINSTVNLSAGNVSVILLDGLFALDDADLLFSGVSEPNSTVSLADASVTVTGYARAAEHLRADIGYRRLMAGQRGRATRADKTLADHMQAAANALYAQLPEQRRLIARLRSVAATLGESGALIDVDPLRANLLVEAADAITRVARKALQVL